MLTHDAMMVTVCFSGLAYGAAHDVAVRTIPNWVSVCIGLVGLCHALLQHFALQAIVNGSLAFCFGLLGCRAAVLGGGDVKLISAVSLWFRPSDEPRLIALIAVAGGVLACFYLLMQRLAPRPAREKPHNLTRRLVRVELRRIRRRASIPYAVAIASATMLCLAQD